MPDPGVRQGPQYRYQVLGDIALEKARHCPDDVAIYLEDEPPITFGSIADEAVRLAAALQQLGLQRGDVLSFQLPNWREAVAIDIAASLLGLVVNPIIPIYRDRELAFILQDAGTRAVFIPESFRGFDYAGMFADLMAGLPGLEHVVVVRGGDSNPGMQDYQELLAGADPASLLKADVDPDDVKIMMYTSGTTGRPKAVQHSHNTLSRALDNGCEGWGLGEGDVMLMPSPVTHVTGFVNGMELPFFSRAKSVLMERWDVDRAISLISRFDVTACVSATPFLQELVDHAEAQKLPLATLRIFACGGASVPPTLIRRTHRVLENCRAFRVYGSTEAPLVTVGFQGVDEEALAAETDGRCYNWDVGIIDDDGQYLSLGSDGEIVVSGQALMLGYADPQQTAESLTADGYFRTGDIGHLTAEGALVITDRKKDIIIRGGENLSAREIEDVLYRHGDVREVAIIAIPHERLGEGVCACIVLEPGGNGLTLEKMKSFLSEYKLAKQKWPERIELFDELPKTASGKVRKDQLRNTVRSLMASGQH